MTNKQQQPKTASTPPSCNSKGSDSGNLGTPKNSRHDRRSKSPNTKSRNERRSRSPQGNNHNNSGSRRRSRPDAVVFPPDPDETGAQVVQRIFAAFGLQTEFPEDCQDYVQKLMERQQQHPSKPDDDDDDSVVTYADYTHLPFITIDGEETRDLDQALYITRQNLPGTTPAASSTDTPNYYFVSYALADAAHYVPAHSPVFQYALRKGGTSLYLPGHCLPMLPPQLCQEFLSLTPRQKRRALVLDMYLSPITCQPVKTFYKWAWIVSRRKGTFREVSEYYQAVDAGKSHSFQSKQYCETLDLLREVGMLRLHQQGGSDHAKQHQSTKKGGVVLDDNGKLAFDTRCHPHYDSQDYNEQISLLANSEGARLLHFMEGLEHKVGEHDVIHPIYRTMAEPRPQQLATLEQVILNTLTAHDIDVPTWGWRRHARDEDDNNMESIADYLERIRNRRDSLLPDSPEAKVWSAVVQVVERQARMSHAVANFQGDPARGHFQLQLEYYARLSSPMRELVGCFTHKELREAHTGTFVSASVSRSQRTPTSPLADIELRDAVIRAAKRAKALQKKLSGAVFLHVMNQLFYQDLRIRNVGKRPLRRGVLIGLNFTDNSKSRRCYVQLEKHNNMEIKVFAQDLEYFYNCRYLPLQSDTAVWSIGPLAGSFREDVDDQERPPIFKIGQRVTIRVADYAQFYGQTSRSRWCFIMDLEQTLEEPDPLRLNGICRSKSSALRNSIVDIDLYSQRDSTSVASSAYPDDMDECGFLLQED
ncbi:Ribonuclease R [Seminavis robusta]|uniref:Ribonuclease R n=1 Tax=Seminavis robusta TaxID=568900 RepID=A0A9N8DDL0_9STRA|nr:Ribonuclease R [Seminavis robusta]|eukprot:Sro45_g026880.1 Ribonuclease R (761) ;mRNA; f:33609-35891